MSTENITEIVKEKYGQAALRVASGGSCCCGDPITSNLYGADQTCQLPDTAVLVARLGGPTPKVPGHGATRRDAAPWALRCVPSRRRGTTPPSSPRRAEHPRARASRARSSGGLNP